MEQKASGVLYVHSSPRFLCPHIEWSLGRVLGRKVSLHWKPQPILDKTFRAEYYWQGQYGSASQIASLLQGWEHIRFEITEDTNGVVDGGRWMYTPDLGIFFAQTDTSGNMVVQEDRLRNLLQNPGMNLESVRSQMRLILGQSWDDELEAFRYAGDESSSVVWLHNRVG